MRQRDFIARTAREEEAVLGSRACGGQARDDERVVVGVNQAMILRFAQNDSAKGTPSEEGGYSR